MKKFCERLKELRVEKGMTQLSLAQKFNLKQAAISQWESGCREPNLDMVISLARFFKVSTDYLLGLED